MDRRIISAAFYICIFAVIGLNSSFTSKEDKQLPKNIIIMIGDGMGLSQMSSAFYYCDQDPSFQRFPIVGLSRTSSSKEKITDSAAGATAISTGEKSYNGAIGVDGKKKKLETLLEYFAGEGKKTGLIATSSITHATPASFYAHQESRHLQMNIATELVNSPVDFFAAGGSKFFNKRDDGKDLIAELKANGFYVNTEGLSKKLPDNENGKYGYLLAEDGMPKMSQGRGNFLTDATELAISALENKEHGFFLMVEGSQIDWGGHANDADYVIKETLDFDKAIGAVVDFAKRDKETLVIVTADHETGGFTLGAKKKFMGFGGLRDDYAEIAPSFSTRGHSATMVPVLAFGPGAEAFSGIYQNTAIYQKIMAIVK